jgi:hypothetical protein
MWKATSVYSILRGQVTDEFGDPKDTDNAVHLHIPGSVTEVRSIVTTTAEGRGQQIRFLVGRLPEGTDVRHEDRLRDEHSGEIYMIDAIGQFRSPIMGTGVRLDLRRVT